MMIVVNLMPTSPFFYNYKKHIYIHTHRTMITRPSNKYPFDDDDDDDDNEWIEFELK